MLTTLYLYNFATGYNIPVAPQVFMLKTCQRTLILSTQKILSISLENCQHFNGDKAYTYLMEMICGLKSELLAESEITGQVKEAYREYMKKEDKDPIIVRILEKLFKDAKEIRTSYLIGIGQKTYGAITKKILARHVLQKDKADVLVLGTGKLAIQIVENLKKKYRLFITGRNSQKVHSICLEHDINSIPWNNLSAYASFAFVINTIGTDEVLGLENFWDIWHKKNPEDHLLIDLASPSPFKPRSKDLNFFVGLDKVFAEGAIREQEKNKKINEAYSAIEKIVMKRKNHLSLQHSIRNSYLSQGCSLAP